MKYAYQWYLFGIPQLGDYTVNFFNWLNSVGGKFRGINWKNITVQEMIRLYGVMICMIIQSRHLGRYEGNFKTTSYVRFVHGYNVKLVGYGGWAERIMTLDSFYQIRSDFNQEAGESDVCQKCHKLRYLIMSVNDT